MFIFAPKNLPIEAQTIFRLLCILILVMMLVVVSVSFGISHFVVNRINRIASTSKNIIDTQDLSQRISIETKWDDLSNLAQILNLLFEQIEGLMISVREVSNNIAHDLRTPLSGLRADIEQLKGKTVEDKDIDALLAEADRILMIFQSLLRITNITKGKRYEIFHHVNLRQIIQDVIELYDPVAEEKSILIQSCFSDPIDVKGDANLLFQLFANLLDNAIKYSPAHSEISIKARNTYEGIEIQIIDQGIGIEDKEKSEVFRYFYRCDKSRSSCGFGLGLSLVKAIIEKHRGDIFLEDSEPGLCVKIHLKPYQ